MYTHLLINALFVVMLTCTTAMADDKGAQNDSLFPPMGYPDPEPSPRSPRRPWAVERENSQLGRQANPSSEKKTRSPLVKLCYASASVLTAGLFFYGGYKAVCFLSSAKFLHNKQSS